MRRTLRGATIGGALLAAATVWAATHHTITVDGDLADFAADEKLAGDAVGDSAYGANNDLGELHVTWDAQNLYLGFGYSAWGTGVIYLVDTGAGGVSSLCPNAGYTGAFPANVQGTGFNLMVALFAPDGPTTSAAFVYTLAGTGSTDISMATGVDIQLKETINTTALEHVGAVEVRVPWDALFGLGPGKVPPGAQIKLAGLIRGKLDGDGLGDVSPDQAGTVNQGNCWSGSGNSIVTLHEVSLDSDGDSAPDPGWSPGSNGPKSDAGPLPDGTSPDSATPPDGAVPSDVSPAPDRQVPGDVTVAHDQGGVSDALPADAGALSADAGALSADAGTDGERQEEGCACSAKGSSATAAPLALALLGLVLVRPRRRRR